MTVPAIPDSAAERARLENCVREPIRHPNSIQPHGGMLTVDGCTHSILQASANASILFGRSASELPGTPLADVIGAIAVHQIDAVLAGQRGFANPVPVIVHGAQFDVIVHDSHGVTVVEFEPALPADEYSSTSAVYAALSLLGAASTREQLWSAAARDLHDLTGFDQVMVYHFHPDGHGQVVAEHRSHDSIRSYLGLHFPASDIPAQARNLYLTKTSRMIASTANLSHALLPDRAARSTDPVDLSGAELRSVSPHHSRFMRNLGQAATLSFSLVVRGELVGMITCAHRTARRLPYTLRQALEVFTGQVALLLGALSEIRRLKRATELLLLRKTLVEQFSSNGDPAQALLHGTVTLFDLVAARGAAVHHQGRLWTAGDGLDQSDVQRLVQRMLTSGGRLPFASESLAAEHADLAEIMPSIAGVLIVPFGPDGDYLAWFRAEMTESIVWLGDQSESNRDSLLSPRNSFSAWSGSVCGLAEPWGTDAEEAVELGCDLGSAFLRRVESTLAHFALHDGLTGLANRRLLLERLDHAISRLARSGHLSVLFIDIDSFKSLNDLLGHHGGDAVLVQIAERLLSSARSADTVARLGGDEFVVVCEATDADTADVVAHRLLTAFRPPVLIDGREVLVTASIGVATGRTDDTAAGLIRRADDAMYRAKRGGKDRLAHEDA